MRIYLPETINYIEELDIPEDNKEIFKNVFYMYVMGRPLNDKFSKTKCLCNWEQDKDGYYSIPKKSSYCLIHKKDTK